MKGANDSTAPPSGPAGSGSGSGSVDYGSMPKKSSGMTIGIVVVAVLVVLGIVAYGATAGHWFGGGSKNEFNCTQGTLNGVGSTFVYPLMNDWAITYASDCGTQVNYQSLGSGAGVAQLTAKTVDFGASDAPLSAAQRAALPHSALTIPETIGAVTVMYNIAGVLKGLNLTGNIVAEIYLGTDDA